MSHVSSNKLSTALESTLPVSRTITRSEGSSLTIPGSAFHTAGALIKLRPYRSVGQDSGWLRLHSVGMLAGVAAKSPPTASPKTESMYSFILS